MGLSFGYNKGLPEGIEMAWGARLIVDQRGYTDLVPNRQSWLGDPAPADAGQEWLARLDALQAWLNGGPLAKARERASELLKGYEMSTRAAQEFVLYEDATGIIKGNTNASAGYLYVCAYLREDEARTPGGTEITPGLTVREVSDEELAAASPTYREALEKRGEQS